MSTAIACWEFLLGLVKRPQHLRLDGPQRLAQTTEACGVLGDGDDGGVLAKRRYRDQRALILQDHAEEQPLAHLLPQRVRDTERARAQRAERLGETLVRSS